ncbi:hypothetical protein IEQ34_018565 [Dendrobium chrysotoxum]|uniref:Uncharacterized protein n=1 Tax=Dendrobium chrysotoxum TaxID=161865 RepID=A0AAV7G4W6_DENCH|nr:hypothetical protein IEQ34_018565 [Dendrobium chrysotoxum]
MQLRWNTWLHIGSKRRISSSSNSQRQTAHSSNSLPNLCPFTSEYTIVGNVSSRAESKPLICPLCWGRVIAAGVTRDLWPPIQQRM